MNANRLFALIAGVVLFAMLGSAQDAAPTPASQAIAVEADDVVSSAADIELRIRSIFAQI